MLLAELHKALSDETRLRLVHLLSHGFFNVQELTSIIGISQSTISHHLKVLQSTAIALCKKEGTWAYYSLTRTETTNSLPSLLLHATLTAFKSSSLNGFGETLHADRLALTTVLDARRARSQRFFNEVAPQWKELRDQATSVGGTDASTLNELASRIPKEATLLDVGCGAGALLEKILPRKGETIGVDYSPAMLAEAARTLGERASQVDLRLGSLEHLPVADNTVDVAVVCMVLHHISNPQEALRDLYRVLKPQGSLLVVDLTPHREERMREQFSHLWLGFDPKEFTEWLAACGFRSEAAHYFGAHKEIFLLPARRITASSSH